MKNKLYNLKSKYLICITLILVLGLIGSSYAMWSETHFLINELNTGFLQANIKIELADNQSIIVTEEIIITNCDDNQGGNNNGGNNNGGNNNGGNNNGGNNNGGNDNGGNNNGGNNNGGNDNGGNNNGGNNNGGNNNGGNNNGGNNEGSGNQTIVKEYSCNYDIIPFSIENKGTVPLKLEEYGISLNSIDISHICSIILDDLVITDEYMGFIQIDNNKLEELAGLINNNENNNIILTFHFKQTNLYNGGWTQEEIVYIPILKNTETTIIDDNQDDEHDDQEDNNQANSSNIIEIVDRGGKQ